MKKQPFPGKSDIVPAAEPAIEAGEASVPVLTVAIGGSAGGHEALERLFTDLPSDCGLSFVVVMHLPADGSSLLADLIGNYTSMEVLTVEDGMALRPNTVHVAPPGKYVVVSGGRLRFSAPGREGRTHHPIDLLFTSLAAELGQYAIAVILSGFGFDGSEGVKRVKEEGGLVLIQDPETTINPFMPQSAIATGAADAILSVEEIADRLVRAAGEKGTRSSFTCQTDIRDEELQALFTLLKARTNHDFSSYKRNTVLRRIERRMVVNGAGEFGAYLDILEGNPLEAQALCQELLIGVTSFFRDPEAFELVRNKIIPNLFANRKTEEPVRVWHACCATGEEAYSVAMLLLEYLEKENLQTKVQIFATDLDEVAVARARAGIYSDAIIPEVGEERLKRFFTKNESGWQVTKQLRETIVFAHHNLIKDPPFSRLDLLVCRNFFIYLNPDIQKLLIPLFHQVLNPGSYLFLGSAETVGHHGDLFTPVDKKWKIFRRQGGKSRIDALFPFSGSARKLVGIERSVRSPEAQETATIALADKLLMERYVPAHVIINERNEVVHFSNRAGAYLVTPEGKPTRDLLKIAREELRPALRAAIYKAFTNEKEIVYRGIQVGTNGGERTINTIVVPINEPPPAGKLALVILEPAATSTVSTAPGEGAGPGDDASRNSLTRHLEEQLRVTGEQLQSACEQLETTNERCMLANEELMTVNEELQSTNEKLQSTNEELVTVNSELQRKMEELNQSNSDLENLFTSSEIATFFLDRLLFIKRFSPAMAAIFNLIPADIGRSVHHLNSTIDWSNLPVEAKSVLETLVPVEREVHSQKDGRSFIMRVLPYRTTEGVVDGIVVTLVDISERKRAEEALLASEKALREGDERLRFALDTCHIGAWDLNLEDRTVYRSEEHSRIFGYSEMLPQWTLEMFLNHVLPEDRGRVAEIIRQGMTTPRGWSFECRIRRADGPVRWIWVAGRHGLDMVSGVRRVAGVVQDITDRKEAEEALRESRAKLAAALASMMDAVVISDSTGQFIEFNDAFVSFHRFGDRAACFEKLTDYGEILEVFTADGERASLEMWAIPRALRGETVANAEYTLRRKDTGETWVGSYSFSPIRDAQGAIVGSVVVGRDITELKQKEEALRRSEAQYHTLFDTLIEGFCTIEMVFDTEGRPVDYRFLEMNPAFAKQTGLHGVQGRLMRDLAPDHEEYWFEIYGKVALTGESVHFENEAKALGRFYDVCAYRIGGSESCKVAILFNDITERKHAEEEIRQSESRLKRLVEILQHPAETIQGLLDNALEQALQLTESKFGYIYHYREESKELVLNSWSRDVMPACAVANPQTCYELDKTGIWGEAVRQRRPFIINDFQADHALKKGYPEGHVPLLKFATIPIFKNDRIVSVVGLANKENDYDQTDILQISLLMDTVWKVADSMRSEEENIKLQAHLIQAQKMEAIGTLAGGIAHDFNNILGAVLGYAEMARDASPAESALAHYLDKVLEASGRATNLVKQILAFSRQVSIERVPLEPVHLVKEALKLLRPALPSTITIKHQLDAVTRPILADPTQMHQIVMNLCTNAFHAMEQTGGILEITLKDCELSPQDLPPRSGVQAGSFVMLAIADTGPGIAPAIREKIFEPYFTTKEVGKGTGMGLSIVHGIVTAMGGFIMCEGDFGKGAIFRIFLPAQERKAAAAIPSAVPVVSGQERILFIDDEKMLAEMGKIMLERLGYRVTVCTGSMEALAAFEEQPQQFDAVITDQTMPGLTGVELARRMLRIRPDIPIILCTGYSNLVNEEQTKALGIKGFIMKPMAKRDIAQLLREVLEGTGLH